MHESLGSIDPDDRDERWKLLTENERVALTFGLAVMEDELLCRHYMTKRGSEADRAALRDRYLRGLEAVHCAQLALRIRVAALWMTTPAVQPGSPALEATHG